MRVELVNIEGRVSRYKIVLDCWPALIGRAADAHVRLPDREVSRRHCQLELRDGIPAIHDLGSTNGTYVNGRNITDSRLMPGDRLQFGNNLFLVQYTTDGEGSQASGQHPKADYQIDPYKNYWVFHGNPCSVPRKP